MSVPGPTLGPCQVWIDADDVGMCCTVDSGSDPLLVEQAAVEASMVMFELSGEQFPGLCTRTVRPCATRHDCFGLGAGVPYFWTEGAGFAGYGFWRSEGGDRCGCSPLSQVKLAGYPVREILEVKIDGVVVDPAEYRLDGWRRLVRLADPGPPVRQRRWPGCQQLDLDDGPGTFIITYRWGVDPPELARRAAAEVACQILASCAGASVCKLPSNATRVTRQGVTVERQAIVNWLDPKKPTGLPNVDLFMQSYPVTGRRRSAVFSPDVPGYPRVVN